MKYKDSGVNIDAASNALSRVKSAIASTWGEEVASEVGNFGGLFRQPDGSFLVSSIDGVGTKSKIALAAGNTSGIGADLVNHSINDVLVQGASPLFFLDYFAAGKLNEDHFVPVVEGMAQACRDNGCALIGGETAEMPGIYHDDDFDLAGCIIGRVSAEDLLTSAGVKEGMLLYAWPSSGLHTNGYSLVRKVLTEGPDALPLHEDPGSLGVSLAEALLAVHRSYLNQVLEFRKHFKLGALCHITGGGLVDNIPRVLPEGIAVEIDLASWQVPPIYGLIAERGEIESSEMRRVFNLGIGMVAFAGELSGEQLSKLEEAPFAIGKVVARDGEDAVVQFKGNHNGLS